MVITQTEMNRIPPPRPSPKCDSPACNGNIRETGLFAIATFYSEGQNPSMLRWCNKECFFDWIVSTADVIRQRPTEIKEFIPYTTDQ